MIMFLFIVLLLLSVFLIMIVLLQRGRGAGLAGAFGSGGAATSAFGTKIGDVFTTVTVIAFVLFMLLSIALFMKIKWGSQPDQAPGRVKTDAALDDAEDITETSLKLVWKDDSSNHLGYHILRTDDPSKPFIKVGDAPADHNYYVDTNLTPGTEYFYEVEAWNNGGVNRTLPQNALHATTKGVKPPAPLGPELPTGTAPAAQTAPAARPATTSQPAIGPPPTTATMPAAMPAATTGTPPAATPPASATAPATPPTTTKP